MNLTKFYAETVDKSIRCRPFRTTARKIAACCLLTPERFWHSGMRPRDLKPYVKAKCEAENVGNPLIFIAILGIIINLVWQWWLHRKANLPTGVSAEDEWHAMRLFAEHDLRD